MKNNEVKELCLNLLKADSEDEVVAILKKAGHWDDRDIWRYYGDNENNYSTIGNQQSRPESALVEKVVNSVDAQLMNECQVRGINVESLEAPQSIRSAVAQFFEGRKLKGEIGGKIRAWDDKKRRDVARSIAVVASGAKPRDGNPCFTIIDQGEGQSPENMPFTLLSIGRKNKQRIPFVQGKFNMGGTGVLRFCSSKYNLQLIITKRNPDIVNAMKEKNELSEDWGFTIVRRQDPEGMERNSVYTYLAPIGADCNPRKGNVLSFKAKSLPLMPEHNEPYKREIEWGTAIKLYEYQARGFKSNAIMPDGLTYRLELLLPEIALPIRLHECRKGFAGDPKRSFEHNINGLLVRLEDGRHDNLEKDFPDTQHFELEGGEKFTARIYAFKRNRAKTYRKNEGIIFMINGQTHGYLPLTFFGRKNLKKISRLARSILVVVDATNMTRRAQEDLFPNSRDRLSSNDFRASLEGELEEMLKNHSGLRALSEKRKREETEERLADSKPFEEILASIIKKSPSLSALFTIGRRLPNPNKPKEVEAKEEQFVGNEHPTFFRFKKLQYGRILKRSCPINHRCRILFETDAVNNYFDRAENPGRFSIHMFNGIEEKISVVHNINIHNGAASLNIKLPEDVKVSDILKFETMVRDDIIPEPFINGIELLIQLEANTVTGKSTPRKPPSENDGKGAESQLGIELPPIDTVKRDRWDLFEFDQHSACAIRQDESENDPDTDVYEFHINVDNVFLQTEIKESNKDAKLLEVQFVYGIVLTSLAVIKENVEYEKRKKNHQKEGIDENNETEPIEQQVGRVTRAIAPFILPMIKSLGGLEDEDIESLSFTCDDE